MRTRPVTTKIDPERCTGCGLCISVCPSDTLSLFNGKATVTGNESMNCGHCMAVCPQSAIRVEALENDTLTFSTFSLDRRWLPWGQFDPHSLARLMASRRSCRSFTSREIPRIILEDLIRLGTLAPSGTNSQLWTFQVFPTREKVKKLTTRIGDFYRDVNTKAGKPWLRFLLKCVGRPELDTYYREYYDSVNDAISQMETGNKDLLFHGATAVIAVGAKPGASCPAEDALLATENILLGAHAMGLGTCLIGYAVIAMARDRRIAGYLGLVPGETIHAVIALGYPAETYQTITGRKPVSMKFF
ncbi:MAG: nitroreductase family protein [Pseudomonadota bacterium]